MMLNVLGEQIMLRMMLLINFYIFTITDFQFSIRRTGSNFFLLYFKLEVVLKIGSSDRFLNYYIFVISLLFPNSCDLSFTEFKGSAWLCSKRRYAYFSILRSRVSLWSKYHNTISLSSVGNQLE